LATDRLMAQANSQLWQPKHLFKSVTMIFIGFFVPYARRCA